MQWNWEQAKEIQRQKPLVLAGGLSPDNIFQAVIQGRPDAVDVSSGVEASPGIKDVGKINKFINAIPQAPWALKVF